MRQKYIHSTTTKVGFDGFSHTNGFDNTVRISGSNSRVCPIYLGEW